VLVELPRDSVVILERHDALLEADIPTLRRLVQFRQGGDQQSRVATDVTHHKEPSSR
jgi:hypothetical protein